MPPCAVPSAVRLCPASPLIPAMIAVATEEIAVRSIRYPEDRTTGVPNLIWSAAFSGSFWMVGSASEALSTLKMEKGIGAVWVPAIDGSPGAASGSADSAAGFVAHVGGDIQFLGFIPEGPLAVGDHGIGDRPVLIEVEVVIVFRNLHQDHIAADVSAVIAWGNRGIEPAFLFRRFRIRLSGDLEAPILVQRDIVQIVLADPSDFDCRIAGFRVDPGDSGAFTQLFITGGPFFGRQEARFFQFGRGLRLGLGHFVASAATTFLRRRARLSVVIGSKPSVLS